MSKELVSPLMLLRKKVGLSQSDLAEALGVSRTSVMYWETGRTEPALTLVQYKTLCKVLNVSPEELPDSFGPQAIDAHTTGLIHGPQN